MNTPGASIFQGADSLKINSSLDRAEEEEELEDQRRRNEELGNLLQNAFDDLEDDESTVDSTTNFQAEPSIDEGEVDRHHEQFISEMMKQVQTQSQNAFETEINQLKLLLESKTHELENIKQLANDEAKKSNELQKRLTITEAELDRALANKRNTHELLVESKEKCSNLENTIAKLRNDKKSLEVENNNLLGKLETAQTLLSDVQRKYDMVERDMCKNNERNVETRLKEMQDRHRAEIEMMQQQLEQTTDKLDKKVNELENMQTRYNALQCSHEKMLVDKVSKINELSDALNRTQQRCEELMHKEDHAQENKRLHKLIVNLQEQAAGQEKTITTLNERLQATSTELEIMDTLLHQHNLDDTPHGLTQPASNVVGSTPLHSTKRVGSLKDELYRALANVKTKREELRKLTQTLHDKDKEIRALKSFENKTLVEINTLRDDKQILENRVKLLEEEYKNMQTKAFNKSSLNKELVKELTAENDTFKKERDELVVQRDELEVECQRLDMELKNVRVDLEELKQEADSMKANYEQLLQENSSLRSRTTADNTRLELERHKFLLADAQAECDRLKNLYVEISNAKEALACEVNKLRTTDSAKELGEQREKVANLQRALQLAEIKSAELRKLLDAEKLSHERDLTEIRDKIEKEKYNHMQMERENAEQCTKCIEYIAEITRFEIQNLKLTSVNAISKQHIDELSKELRVSKTQLAELTEKLKLSEEQEALIEVLNEKAQKFEEYMKQQGSSSEKSTGSPNHGNSATSSDKGVGTSPETERAELKKIEARIRDQMAQLFAGELKQYQLQLHRVEEKHMILQHEYQQLTNELQQRYTEVEVLKKAVLTERAEFQQILAQRDSEHQAVLKKQNDLLEKHRYDLQMKNMKFSQMAKELNERQRQIEAERKSMKAVMTQWEEQRKDVDALEKEWKAQIEEIKQMHDTEIMSWQTKYNSAKRTAANYKRYSEDKEAHMQKEYERVKYEYNSSLTKLEMRLKEVLHQKDLEIKATEELIAKSKQDDVANNKENNKPKSNH